MSRRVAFLGLGTFGRKVRDGFETKFFFWVFLGGVFKRLMMMDRINQP